MPVSKSSGTFITYLAPLINPDPGDKVTLAGNCWLVVEDRFCSSTHAQGFGAVRAQRVVGHELLSLVAVANASVANTWAAEYIPISAKCRAFFSYSVLLVIILTFQLNINVEYFLLYLFAYE